MRQWLIKVWLFKHSLLKQWLFKPCLFKVCLLMPCLSKQWLLKQCLTMVDTGLEISSSFTDGGDREALVLQVGGVLSHVVVSSPEFENG
jgi:hypothetical protein